MRCNATQGGNRCGKSQQNHIFLLQTCHFPLPVSGSTGAASFFKCRPNSWPSGCGMTTWCTASSSLQSDALCDIDDEDGPPTDGSVESPPGGGDGDGSTASCAANPCHDPCQRGRVAPNRVCERLVLSDGRTANEANLFVSRFQLEQTEELRRGRRRNYQQIPPALLMHGSHGHHHQTSGILAADMLCAIDATYPRFQADLITAARQTSLRQWLGEAEGSGQLTTTCATLPRWKGVVPNPNSCASAQSHEAEFPALDAVTSKTLML